jgi:hypothetical protein
MAFTVLQSPESKDILKILLNGFTYEVSLWKSPNEHVQWGRLQVSPTDPRTTRAFYIGEGYTVVPAAKLGEVMRDLRKLVDGVSGMVGKLEGELEL